MSTFFVHKIIGMSPLMSSANKSLDVNGLTCHVPVNDTGDTQLERDVSESGQW